MESGEQPPKKTGTITRRGLLGAVVAGGAGYALKKFFGTQDASATENHPLKQLVVPNIATDAEHPPEVWDTEKFETTLQHAISESISKQKAVELYLPQGEVRIKKNLKFDMQDARVSLVGNGTILSLDESLSDIPKEWASEGHNLLEFNNVTGDIMIKGIRFDGGSKRAGKGGYAPPGGPWDAVLFVNGGGPGSGKDIPNGHRDLKRSGSVTVEDCEFVDSEAPGFLAKNLKKASIERAKGENLDTLFVADWCDEITANNLQARNCLSEGVGVYGCYGGSITNCDVTTARQGFLIHGCDNIVVSDCTVEDAAIGYVFDQAGVNNKPNSNLMVRNSNSQGTVLAYAMAHSQEVGIENSRNEEMGTWLAKFNDGNGDFLHTGIADIGNITAIQQPLWLGSGTESVTFSDVVLKKATDSHYYTHPREIPGIKNEGF